MFNISSSEVTVNQTDYVVNSINIQVPSQNYLSSFTSPNLLTIVYSCDDQSLDFYSPLDNGNETTKEPTASLPNASYICVDNVAPTILLIGGNGNNGTNTTVAEIPSSEAIVFNNCEQIGWSTQGTSLTAGTNILVAQLTINKSSSGTIKFIRYGEYGFDAWDEHHNLTVTNGVIIQPTYEGVL